jgi:hypothetical protein
VRRAAAALAAAALTVLAAFAIPATAKQGKRPHSPFATASMRAFLATRSGDITAAVYNLRTGRLFLYRPGVAQDEASIAKVDIVATLLHENQLRGEPLSPGEAALAAGAIEYSDNNDAQQLWNAAGYNEAIAAFDSAAGMTQTILDPEGVWGHYETTALDQVRLLEQLALPSTLLDAASRSYELGLMRSVTSLQAWGVSAGVLAPATVALKNGWLPPSNEPGWQINSIGIVRGRFRHYLIAVLTRDNPSMPYGVQTIDGISQLVWRYLLPRRFRPHAPPVARAYSWNSPPA